MIKLQTNADIAVLNDELKYQRKRRRGRPKGRPQTAH
jgi:hypothetical protein